MEKPQRKATKNSMEEENHHHRETTDTSFTDKSDICQQLLHRYGKSSAPQHRHLCATAAATRSILQSESLPLTPLSYFAVTIDAIVDTTETLDTNAVSALSSFLAIVVPLVPEKSIAPVKAADAVGVLVEMVERPSEVVSASSVRGLVKCLGVLVGFCDLEDWESVKLGFETLLKVSIDKRPKVRKCAQDCVVNVFKSFESSAVIKKASKLLFSLLKTYMPLAVKLTATRFVDGSKDDILSKPEYLEFLHMLNVLKHLVPYLDVKVSLNSFSELQKLMSTQFSALTRHIFDAIEAIFETMGADFIIPDAENIIESLASYVSLRGNPVDTVLFGATLLKSSLNKFHAGEPSKRANHLSLAIGSVAGLLTSEATTASQASNILEELINRHIDRRNLFTFENQLFDDEVVCGVESSAVKSICDVFVNVLNACGGIPNEHILAVISVLFLKLGEASYFYMKGIILKLAYFMSDCLTDTPEAKNLQECIGSAIIAMGPEKLLQLLPISLNPEDFTCPNIWLVPILKSYVVGSSLGFFMEHVVPLAESFQQACRKAKKSAIGQDLQAHARDCWGLLPAFCRYPTDTCRKFGPLAKLLIPFLKEDSFMLEIIATSLQELVNQNRSVLRSDGGVGEFAKLPKAGEARDSAIMFESKLSYPKKTAGRNVKALASCSEELLQALIAVLLESPSENRAYLKDAIGCLASITDSSVTKKIFISSVERYQVISGLGECGKLGSCTNASVDKEESNSTSKGKDAKRCLILELASSIIEGASEDLIDHMYNFIKHTLEETDESGHCEAYLTLNKILEEHSWFCSSKFVELMDLLLGLKSPVDITLLRSRFACFQTLLVHTLESLDQENTKAFLILNEIIVTLKDSKEEGRKAACDILLGIGSSLQNSSCATSNGPYHKLISMFWTKMQVVRKLVQAVKKSAQAVIGVRSLYRLQMLCQSQMVFLITGYLSGPSPHIKSGAVSALSILVYNDTDICVWMPDLVPSVIELLQSKAIEVIKAVLGFVKVLVSSLQVKDLQNFLSEIVNRVLPWSSISRHHFRSKVTIILEILMRRCGSAAVKLLAPDKYRNFVKDVLENRRGNTSSKEAGTTDVGIKLADSSPRGWQKRKRKQSAILSNEEDPMVPRKKRREEKRKGITLGTNGPCLSAGRRKGMKGGKEFKHSELGKLTEGQSQGSGRYKRRNFNSDPSGGKRKTGRTKVSKKNEDLHRPAAASNLPKHTKVGKKWQKQ